MIEHKNKIIIVSLISLIFIGISKGVLAMYVDYATLKSSMLTEAVELPVITPSKFNRWGSEFSDKDQHCLALNVYFEARGEKDVRGKYAVADVVLYRFMHYNYPNTICGVVQDGHYHEWRPDLPVRHKCQFSWWCDGKSDDPMNLDAFSESMYIAKEVLFNPNYEPAVEYALFYHATWVNPFWAGKMEFVETIGNHSFYKYR